MKATKAKKSNWQKIRKLFNDLHLWFGLISDIVVFVVCLTGTVFVYNTEIREAAAPQYYQVASAGKQKINTDSLLRISKDNIKGKVVGIKIPFDLFPDGALGNLWAHVRCRDRNNLKQEKHNYS